MVPTPDPFAAPTPDPLAAPTPVPRPAEPRRWPSVKAGVKISKMLQMSIVSIRAALRVIGSLSSLGFPHFALSIDRSKRNFPRAFRRDEIEISFLGWM